MASQAEWYYAQGGNSVGPMSLEELLRKLPTVGGDATLVYGPGMSDWSEARHVQAIVGARSGQGGPPRPPSGRRSDEIDYVIHGEEMQYVEITLDPGEMVIAEAGAMMYMSPTIKMETVFGDPSAEQKGFWDKLKTAGKRVLTGESLFMTTFTASGSSRDQVAFASPYPGKIVPMHLDQLGAS